MPLPIRFPRPPRAFRVPFRLAAAGSVISWVTAVSPIQEGRLKLLIIILVPLALTVVVSWWYLAKVCGNDPRPSTARDLRLGHIDRLRFAASTLAWFIVGAIPFLLLSIPAAPDELMSLPPLSMVMLAECLGFAWAIAGLTAAIAEGRGKRLFVAHVGLAVIFVGAYAAARHLTPDPPPQILGGFLVDVFSPIVLFLELYANNFLFSDKLYVYVIMFLIYALGCLMLFYSSFAGLLLPRRAKPLATPAPFAIAFTGSLISLILYYTPTRDTAMGVFFLAYPPLLGLVLSVLYVKKICEMHAISVTGPWDLLRFHARTFALGAATLGQATLGYLPFAWFSVDMAPSKGMLIPPLGLILLVQSLLITWAIGGFSVALCQNHRRRKIVAYVLQAMAFVIAYVIMKTATEIYPISILRANRVDAFSPISLYLQRFVHDRPISRLHLMYVASLSIYAAATVVLLVSSFAVIKLRRVGRNS